MKNKNKRLDVYFQTVTPKSAAHGDFAETGHHDTVDVTPDKYDLDVQLDCADLAAKHILQNIGCVEPSSSAYYSGIWYSSVDADTDMRSGEQTFYTVHTKGFSEIEEKRLFEILTGGGK